jgi:predicted dehydrogenase
LKTPETFAEFQFQLRMGDLVIPTIHFGEPLQTECQHFIDCIQTGRQPRTDALNGLRVVRVLEAAERSMAQDGKPVELAQTELNHR